MFNAPFKGLDSLGVHVVSTIEICITRDSVTVTVDRLRETAAITLITSGAASNG